MQPLAYRWVGALRSNIGRARSWRMALVMAKRHAADVEQNSMKTMNMMNREKQTSVSRRHAPATGIVWEYIETLSANST
ncbi:MAG: hypothetical protein ABSC06_17045, partial [Rhodopila sp.]